MARYRFFLGLLLLPLALLAQVKQEKEIRIDRERFPDRALELLEGHLQGVRKLRFYQEIENNEKRYEAKFKKGKLHYSVEFDGNGDLEDVEFIIKKRDIPNQSWEAIQDHLDANYPRNRIIKIQQHHPVVDGDPQKTLQQAFQNLILPTIRYEVVFSAKMDGAFQIYEGKFLANGELALMRRSLPPNYNHVLYQ